MSMLVKYNEHKIRTKKRRAKRLVLTLETQKKHHVTVVIIWQYEILSYN